MSQETTGTSTRQAEARADGPARRYDASLPFADESAETARRALNEQLAPHEPSRAAMENAGTVLYELIRNGIDHGEPCEEHTLEVQWEVVSEVLRLHVTDCGSPNGACPPRSDDEADDQRWRRKLLAPVEPDALRGRGLHLVAALSDEWDVETTDRGTTVSATITLR